MAKGGMEIIEKHVEKGVVGVCGACLLLSLFHWVFSSPRSMLLDGAAIPPANIDSAVLSRASEAKAKINAQRPEPLPEPNFLAEIQALQLRPLNAKVMDANAVAAFGTPRLPLEPGEIIEEHPIDPVELTDVIPPPRRPLVKAERELPNKPSEKLADVLAAHVVAEYPWKELADAWGAKLKNAGSLITRPVPVGLEAEVEEWLPEGQWSEPRKVSQVRMEHPDTAGQSMREPVLPPYNGANVVEISDLRKMLGDPNGGWTSYLMQPDYWQILWPSAGWVDWKVTLPEAEVSKAYAADANAGRVVGPDGMPISPGAATPAASPSPVMNMGGASFARQRAAAMLAREREDESAARRSQAPPMTPESVVTVSVAGGAASKPPTPTLVPPLDYQQGKNSLLVWFHDNSLDPSKIYRYRLRVKLINPVWGFENMVTDRKFAVQPFLWTAFSDWSEPIRIPQATEFFLTGASSGQGAATVKVFARSLGQQVMQQFSVVPGQSIGMPKQIKQAHPITGAEDKQSVDFSTHAVVVALEFKEAAPGARSGVEMVYLDDQGKLRTMTDVRTGDPEYLRYADLVKKADLGRTAARDAAAKAAATRPVVTPPSAGPSDKAKTSPKPGVPPHAPRPRPVGPF
ncbi:MAG: hypothetical protein WC869_04910 [Phycisphaerae bacterium]|jgi:hypothetical protein